MKRKLTSLVLLLWLISSSLLAFTIVVATAMAATTAEDLNSSLITAVLKGQTGTIKKLIAQGANIDYQDVYGQTALIHATIKGNLAAVKIQRCKSEKMADRPQR